ncbi:50S ribosomal protein L11 methyltransferase [Oceanibacterium hippocampi]|uniref:Ribosomal protein L11 methyltransferase n=1 Tax=Oceanibacterium hippocampi TaxID=745714 RepID=A0A1Y5SE17_9PROT|nr:50S ribosomal protein L11 methyltransferase [Oceanibacterium hippocampi]SLN37519.1 Ribosomal protein L11 methyltransferase [Oceanibacterium hippocampi]
MPLSTRPENTTHELIVNGARLVIDRLGDFFDAFADAVVTRERAGEDSEWELRAYFETPPDAAALERLLDGLEYRIGPLTPQDWVSMSRAGLIPVQAGRYYLHGSHDPVSSNPGAVDLLIDAGQAFGTGHHQTTRGCLQALDRLFKEREFSRPYDLGCGSGVLAMAAAHVLRRPVMASDIDARSVAVAAGNARLNHLQRYLSLFVADGPAHPSIRAGGPYDLITANILARPLIRLAPAVAGLMAPGGRLVLAGLLDWQEAQVRSAYRLQGLRLVRRHRVGQWPTLVLGK